MRVLISEDDPLSRRLLEATLKRSGYEVVATANGAEAWRELCLDGAPRLAVLDWMMPQMDGIEVCRHVRQRPGAPYTYIIMLTARGQKPDIVTALEAGADDYLTKPFDPPELRSRLAVGRRILELQLDLESKVRQLEEAATHVKQLQGLLPICMYCKKIRDDGAVWHRLETYVEQHSQALFTHSLCQDCLQRHYPDLQETPAEAAPVEHTCQE